MIFELYIKNCALIEELNIKFDKKLNIITGETGSGKSIIIEALNLCLGGKYDRTFLRKGESEGEVQLVVFSKSNSLNKQLNELGYEFDLDEELIINRKLFEDGKTLTKINGKNIRVSDLKKVMSTIIDIHGQHQNQALYNKENHIFYLDLYGKIEYSKEFKNFKKIFEEYNSIKREIYKLNDNKSDMEVERERDLLKFQIDEITKANLSENEYEDLKTQKEIFENSEKIYNSLSESYEILNEGQLDLNGQIGNVFNLISSISKYDSKLKNIEELSEKIMYEIEELTGEVRTYIDKIDFDQNTLNTIQERLDLINNLRRKYGSSINEILEYKSKIESRLEDIENRKENYEKLQKQLKEKEEELEDASQLLTKKRVDVSNNLEKELIEELNSLNMKDTRFKVNFNKQGYTEIGVDDVEFFISFNLGEDLNPINKVASGGEMSRFMLAFKTILSDVDMIETMIFDEIDSGISGKAAQIVGEKLCQISRDKQIMCITHLPQIAAFGDTHFRISKSVEKNRTFTRLEALDDNIRKEEIARLISGKVISKTTLEHSTEMIKNADEYKINLGGFICE